MPIGRKNFASQDKPKNTILNNSQSAPNSIEIAVIPTAGKGTRMRPATRAVPKGLLPVIDRPATQYVIEEAVRAGVREVVLVVDPHSRPLLEQHYDQSAPLPGLEEVQIHMVNQDQPLGLGHAVNCAAPVVAGRRFFCQLADTIVDPGEEVLPQLQRVHFERGGSVVALKELRPERLTQVGVIETADPISDGVGRLTKAVEKPSADNIPSPYGLVGRYLFEPQIFELLNTARPGKTGEIELTDSIDRLARLQDVWGQVFSRNLLDVGSPALMAHATLVLGLDRFGEPFYQQIKELIKQ